MPGVPTGAGPTPPRLRPADPSPATTGQAQLPGVGPASGRFSIDGLET
jgi:hypothetical protein